MFPGNDILPGSFATRTLQACSTLLGLAIAEEIHVKSCSKAKWGRISISNKGKERIRDAAQDDSVNAGEDWKEENGHPPNINQS